MNKLNYYIPILHFKVELTGGRLIIVSTFLSLFLANLPITQEALLRLLDITIFKVPLSFWVNDVLMTFFFFLIGLELKEEFKNGYFSNLKNIFFPLAAAAGGMIFPAAIYTIFNYGSPAMAGFGIPMATDIAFAMGVLSLLGKRIPRSLTLFLMAFATLDDIGSIVIIALFYAHNIAFIYIFFVVILTILMLVLNYKLNVKSSIIYLVIAVLIWFCMLFSHIHVTIAGIIISFILPAHLTQSKQSYFNQHRIDKVVNYFILPLFAFYNSAIPFLNGSDNFITPISMGVFVALLFGKTIGIYAFAKGAIQARICTMPDSLNWKLIFGAAVLGGIGFTMSNFITYLAFSLPHNIQQSKMGILMASLCASVVGLLFLKYQGLRKNN